MKETSTFTFSLSKDEVRDALIQYVTASSSRKLPASTSFIFDSLTQGMYLSFSSSENGEILQQGQWVKVQDPKDSDRNPFQIRSGEQHEDGIVHYKIIDALQDKASRLYTRDELELVEGFAGIVFPDMPNHVTNAVPVLSKEMRKDAMIKEWEAMFSRAFNKKVQLAPAPNDVSDPVSPTRHRIMLDGKDLGVIWRTEQMNNILEFSPTTGVESVLKNVFVACQDG
jgi:hypothetical protein